jgi:transcriptional regulator with PAS, ATPase and Fis domain
VKQDSTETGLDVRGASPAPTAPYLFVVIEAQRPAAGGARIDLSALDEVAIARGDARAFAAGDRTASLGLDDRRMSKLHAKLQRVGESWELIDQDSKNGCRVDGNPVSRIALRDGAWIEIGQTVLRFRSALPAAGPRFLDAEHAPSILGIVTLEPSFAATLDALARLAPSNVSLAVMGATGTGKELVARGVHEASRRSGPFVAVNCAALPAGLVESQLFGHKKGAFSGATADHDGLVRAADRGTLLLDEVADLPAPAQAALLRVLQEREVLPVGATQPISVDVRFIAATHHDLAARIRAGAFREDLFARLAGHVTTLPPLLARREDIGTIIGVALRRLARSDARLTAAAAHQLATAPWPHNAREIHNVIEAALALAGADPIDVTHLPDLHDEPADDAALRARLEALLVAHRGNVSQIARELGKARMQIQRWLKRYSLDPEAFR